MCREYDPDLDIQDGFFKRLHPSIQEGVLLRFLDLAYDPRPSWTTKCEDDPGDTRRFEYKDVSLASAPLVVTYGIDDTNCRLVIVRVREGEHSSEQRPEFRFFSHGDRGRILLGSFFQEVGNTGGVDEVLGVIGDLIRNPNLGMPHAKPLGDGLHELRAERGNLCYRIFYGSWSDPEFGDIVVFISGLLKKKQEENQREIARAKKLLKIVRKDLARNSRLVEDVLSFLETIFHGDVSSFLRRELDDV
ncbi:MAG: type II toxin-antitoxin system RelE/ParE family toxin [Pseudomonadota bacterium]